MIHHMQTRRALEDALNKVDPKRRQIKWPMTKFRHAIFKVVDECRNIKDCEFGFSTKDEFTYCKLIFQRSSINMSYSYKTDSVLVSDSLTNAVKVCTLEELPSYIHSIQPKVVIKIKKAK